MVSFRLDIGSGDFAGNVEVWQMRIAARSGDHAAADRKQFPVQMLITQNATLLHPQRRGLFGPK
jgi:hypothetical protein